MKPQIVIDMNLSIVRTQNILPEHLADLVGGALDRYEDEIQRGAIIVINEQTRRVRLLPLHH